MGTAGSFENSFSHHDFEGKLNKPYAITFLLELLKKICILLFSIQTQNLSS